jgi:3-phenylpropionate/trans-cinnamate dioxygenase ferredoxin subunit
MPFLKLFSAQDLKPNQMKAADAAGKSVLIVNLEGTFYSIENKCTHMSCSLSNGRLKGENVHCTCHGSIFNVKTGEVVVGPASKSEPKYDVKVENGQVIISI